MKKNILLLFFCLISLNSFAQEYTIVGKGNSGQTKCSGYVWQSGNNLGSEIKVHLSDMLEKSFQILIPEQIDERTIKYTISSDNFNDAYIIKYKCPNNEDVYFFDIPPLYEGQGRTVYKTVKKKFIFNGF